jgi:hypothetical protein
LADSVAARAFTVGADVFFAAGEYRPGSCSGDALIAHEAVHVVQQRGASAVGDLRVSDPGDRLEQEADAFATTFTTSGPGRPSQAATPCGGAALTLARQTSGGPYHPPEGVSIGCTAADDCSTLSTKINYLKHTIASHQTWDAQHPDPAYPNGRHWTEIQDLLRALENCKRLANTNCSGQPVFVPAPQEDPNARRERVREQLYEALPWAVAALVVGLVIACVIAEPCGAAVLAALAAILEADQIAIVLGILSANGVRAGT